MNAIASTTPVDNQSSGFSLMAASVYTLKLLLIVFAVVLSVYWLSHLMLVRHIGDGVYVDGAPTSETSGKPGATLAKAIDKMLEQEANAYLGWQDNDFLCFWEGSSFCLFGDDNRNRQLGMIVVIRETLLRFRENLTRVSSSEAEDQNLVKADTALRNNTAEWWLPSFESKIDETREYLAAYLAGLANGHSRPVSDRLTNLAVIIQSLNDKLGQYHGSLTRTEGNSSWLRLDDRFYEAQGASYAASVVLSALQAEYSGVLSSAKPSVLDNLINAERFLRQASLYAPVVIVESDPNGYVSGLFASHLSMMQNRVGTARQFLRSCADELLK